MEGLMRDSLVSVASTAAPRATVTAEPNKIQFSVRAENPWLAQGTLIRFASFHSGITDLDQEKSHAIQSCYLGARGRLVVRSDCNRICADGPGATSPRHIG
jgi:hypothetical protein